MKYKVYVAVSMSMVVANACEEGYHCCSMNMLTTNDCAEGYLYQYGDYPNWGTINGKGGG